MNNLKTAGPLLLLSLATLFAPAAWAQTAGTFRNGVETNADVTGGGVGDAQTRGPAVSGAARGAISTSMSTAETTAQLRQTGAGVRSSILITIEARVDATEKSVDRLQRSARRLEGDIRDRADAAIDQVKDKEKAVRSSLKAAHKAGAPEWSDARERLAADYEAYAQSVASAEASIGSLETRGSAQNTPSTTRH